MTIGIYKITEIETERCYIGQSKNIEKRWKAHRGKFPVSAFDYEIVVQCFDEPESLDFWERRCIVDYNAHKSCGGFNHTWGGNGAWGSKNPEETRQRRSAAMKGKPAHNKGKAAYNRGKTLPKSQCPHCLGWFAAAPMTQFHGDKCFALTGLPSPSKGKTLSKSQCAHCGIWCAGGVMAQWHGDNCKKKITAH